MTRILVIDDDPMLLKGLTQIGASLGAQVSDARDAESAQRMIADGSFDVVVTDLCLEGDDPKGGLDVIRAVKAKDPFTQVIVVTNYATPEVNLDAMDQGAYDFVERDSPGIDFKGMLRRKIAQAVEYGNLRRNAAKAA